MSIGAMSILTVEGETVVAIGPAGWPGYADVRVRGLPRFDTAAHSPD